MYNEWLIDIGRMHTHWSESHSIVRRRKKAKSNADLVDSPMAWWCTPELNLKNIPIFWLDLFFPPKFSLCPSHTWKLSTALWMHWNIGCHTLSLSLLHPYVCLRVDTRTSWNGARRLPAIENFAKVETYSDTNPLKTFRYVDCLQLAQLVSFVMYPCQNRCITPRRYTFHFAVNSLNDSPKPNPVYFECSPAPFLRLPVCVSGMWACICLI